MDLAAPPSFFTPRQAARAAAVVVTLIGVVVLAGWLTKTPTLASLFTSAGTMKANTAVAFVLGGLALFWQTGAVPGTALRKAVLGAAALTAAIGVFTLLEIALGWGSLVDQFVAPDPARDEFFGQPGRMAPATALALALVGLALFALTRESRRAVTIFQTCALLALVVGLLAFVGYIYGVEDFYHLRGYNSVSPPTALGLLLLAFGVLSARPHVGIMRDFASRLLGGQMARRTWLPTVLGVLLLGGLLESLGAGYFGDRHTPDILLALANVACFSVAIWLSTRALNRAHARLQRRERLHAVLSQANQSIARIRDRAALFEQICQIALKPGGFRSVWIGLTGSGGASLDTAAQAGAGALAPQTRALAETVWRENRSIVAEAKEDRRSSPPAEDRRPVSAHAGARAAFPIRLQGRPIGALVVESDERHFFDEEEVQLLDEVTGDISAALDAMAQDVHRRMVEQALRESQARLQLAVAAAHLGYWDWDLVHDRVYFSPEWKRQLGFGDEEIMGDRETTQARIHPQDRPRIAALLKEYLELGGVAYESEFRMRHKDESYRWIHSRAQAVRDDGGKALRLVGWHMDITARRLAEESVRESEARLQAVIENLTEGLIVADLDGQLLHWNRAALALHGFADAAEWLRRLPDFTKIYELVDRDGRVLAYDEWPLTRIMRGERVENLELVLRRVDAGAGPWERIFSYGGAMVRSEASAPLAFLTVTDVTARALAEAAMRESATRLREIADHVDEVFWITDPAKHGILYISPAYEKIWGRSCGSIYAEPTSWTDAVHADDRPRVVAAIEKQIHGGYDETYRIFRPDGALRWVRDRAFPVRDEAGHVYRIVGTAQDVTARKLAEARQELQHKVVSFLAEGRPLDETLPRALELVCRAMDWSMGEIWLFDRPAGCLRCAEAWHRASPDLKGFAAASRELAFLPGEGLPGIIWNDPRVRWWQDLAHDPDFARQSEVRVTSLESALGAPVRVRDQGLGVLLFFAPRGPEPDAEARTLVANIGYQLAQFIQRARIEEQFRQAQKMEAVGQLAGGVAHDFNNVLTVIKAYPQLIGAEASLSAEAREWLGQISIAADRAAGLTRQLLAFSRKQVMSIHALDLNSTVQQVSEMLRRIIGEDIALQLDCAPDLPRIAADSGMMEQVLLNLVVNARDAMPAGGHLVISTRRGTIGAADLPARPRARAGEFVVLSVRDTGCGMTDQVIAHIFEPFFTTKEQGKGTGLGLATVYGIAEQHRGWIEVESSVGVGSTFTVFFPVLDEPAEPEPAAPVAAEMRPGRETILLVEDEPAVRMLSKIVLERLGYRVLDAVSGLAALDVWREQGGGIDLLVTDMVMPQGVMGRDLAEQLRAQQPKLRVLFTTGYSPAGVARGLNLIEGVNFIQKPYVPQVLAQAVRHCLERGPIPLS